MVAGLVGLLFSPGKGLFVYNPVLLLGLVRLLVDDLPSGRPATLWISLLGYGTAVIVGTRRARRPRPERPPAD